MEQNKIEDNSVIFYFMVKGKQKKFKMDYEGETHLIPFNSSPIKKLTLGKNLTCYGQVVANIENEILINYQHLTSGHYEFKYPFSFITFHLDKV